ncbi:MAG: SH3 domain-containing protein [Deltaproteobacteria bacterium]|nr:SH3 domain-containing protein [Deltaproteobacteria bacterium]
MISIKRLTFVIVIGVLVFCNFYLAYGQDKSVATLFSNNKKIEEEADSAVLFMEAMLYENLIRSGMTNGEIYYNLGNSYFKMGMLGKAILNYRLAELYLPRDEDLKANIGYARQLTKDRIEEKQFLPFLKEFCFWYSKLNLKELLIVFLLFNGLFWILATIRIFWKREYQNLILLINLALVLVLGCSLVLKLYNCTHKIGGVVLAKEITVRAGNGINNTALFQLHDGAEFKIIEQDGDWFKVELGDGKRGWVQSKYVGKCQLHTSSFSVGS